MGGFEVATDGCKRGRHANIRTTPRVCSGANPFYGLETPGQAE